MDRGGAAPPSPRVVAEHPPPVDDRARAEAALIADQRLSQVRRDEAFREHFHRARVCVFWIVLIVGMALALVGLGVWVYHLLAPTAWRFLSSDEIGHLQNLLITGVSSALGTKFLSKVFDDDA